MTDRQKPECAVRGMVLPGAMCPKVIVGMNLCGFGGKCEHQRMPTPARECCNADCGWTGYTDRMCGSVGPLCPDCGEVTEAA